MTRSLLINDTSKQGSQRLLSYKFSLRNLHEPLPKRYLKLPKLIRKAKWKVKCWRKVLIIITNSAYIIVHETSEIKSTAAS